MKKILGLTKLLIANSQGLILILLTLIPKGWLYLCTCKTLGRDNWAWFMKKPMDSCYQHLPACTGPEMILQLSLNGWWWKSMGINAKVLPFIIMVMSSQFAREWRCIDVPRPSSLADSHIPSKSMEIQSCRIHVERLSWGREGVGGRTGQDMTSYH